MKPTRRRLTSTLLACGLALAGLTLASLTLAGLAQAQVPKDKGPVRLVVGFPAGGSADVLARNLADKLKDELAMPVVVDNRVGAGGQIAAEYVKGQAGDGLTILLATHHMMVMAALTSRTVRYDAIKDFKPIARLASFQECFAIPASSPATTVAQWLEIARADPKKASYGVPAPGSLPQFIGYQMGAASNTRLLPVPYRGAAPVTQDLLGGQLAAGVIPVADLVQYHGTRVRILAVNGERRSSLLPDVPTLKELGYNQFDELEWAGVFVPAATPAATVAQLEGAIQKVLGAKDVRDAFAALGMETDFSAGSTLITRIQGDTAKWAPVIKASGFSAD